MGLRLSRQIALAVGLMLPAIETWRPWNQLADWPSWLDDYLAGALLLYGWWAGRGEIMRCRPYLMAAWGYTLGMAYMSFFGQLRSMTTVDPSGVPILGVLAFKGFGLFLAATGLALSGRESA